MIVYGADDDSIPGEEHERITGAVSKAKKRYILSVFPNSGHGFLSDRRDRYAPVPAQEVWDMTLNFFARNLA